MIQKRDAATEAPGRRLDVFSRAVPPHLHLRAGFATSPCVQFAAMTALLEAVLRATRTASSLVFALPVRARFNCGFLPMDERLRCPLPRFCADWGLILTQMQE